MSRHAPFILALSAIAAFAHTVAAQRPTQSGSAARTLPIVAGAFDGTRPVGLFQRYMVSFSGGNRIEIRTLLFLSGSRITRTLPVGRGDVFDLARCNPDMCGTWQMAGEQLSVRWDNGSTDSWSFRRTADGVEVDGALYRPARALSQAVLAGTWKGAQTSGDPTENVYTFLPNGTFTLGAAGKRLSGRYTITGYALSLTFSDGTTAQRTVYGAGASDPPSLIAIDDALYRR